MNEEPTAATVATAELPKLRRVLATKQIDREVGVPIAPGQIVELPEEQAEEALKDGRAKDPDAKPESKKQATDTKA